MTTANPEPPDSALPRGLLHDWQLRELVAELTGADQVYGVNANESQTELQARVFTDGRPYLYTFSRDPQTGDCRLVMLAPLGQLKL